MRRSFVQPARRSAHLVALLALAASVHACRDAPSAPTTGSVRIAVSGLPAGADASVVVSGPAAFSRTLTAGGALTALVPGTYTVAASTVTVGGAIYAPTPAQQVIVVTAGTQPLSAAVVYALISGELTVEITGLPAGVAGAVSVVGAAPSRQVTATQTLTGLLGGAYDVVAVSVVTGGVTYAPIPVTQRVVVSAGATSLATPVAYSLATVTAGLDVRIDGMYLTQSVQTYQGAVPLVQGRDGYLRVFVVANQSNTTQTTVRVRFYQGASLVYTATIPSPSGSVPTAVNEGSFFRSWNVAVPGSLIQPGLSVIAEVDPDHVIAEANETDNVFPASGSPTVLDVRTMPALTIRFVPVVLNGVAGNVSDANKEAFLTTTKRIHPIAAYDADVHAPYYSTTTTALVSDNSNGTWGKVLSEVDALRVAEAPSRNYFGVVHASYGSGTSGIGFVGRRTALGWDYLPSGDATLAHELGHNWGRQHSPCGGASNPDPVYPYANASIGVFGLDVATAAVKTPTGFSDIMGYCPSQWISDYTYSAILNFRSSAAAAAVASANAAVQPSLLVWGRVENGQLVLEPAFAILTRPTMPSAPGPYRVEGLAADGSRLFSISFTPDAVADARDGDAQFAFAIPLDAATEDRLATLRLSVAGQETRATSALVMAGAPVLDAQTAPDARVLADGRVQVRWDAATHPMVMIRDARTGEVLSFARGGSAAVRSGTRELELVLSDRVRSVARRVTIRRP